MREAPGPEVLGEADHVVDLVEVAAMDAHGDPEAQALGFGDDHRAGVRTETVPYPLSRSDDLEKSVAEISSAGVKAIGLRCDVRDENQVKETVDRATMVAVDLTRLVQQLKDHRVA